MKKRFQRYTFLFLMAAGIMPAATGQAWTDVGDIVFPMGGNVYPVYGDSVLDMLLVGATDERVYVPSDTLYPAGISRWDGWTWSTFPDTLQVCNGFCQGTYSITRFQGRLLVSGAFGWFADDGQIQRHFVEWIADEDRWSGIGCYEPASNGVQFIVPTPVNDTLFFTGYWGSLCGLPESNIFMYDGSGFHPFPLGAELPLESSDYVGFVFRFQGLWYITGLFEDQQGNTRGMLRYNMDGWEPVPGFETDAPIKDVLIHNGTLYLCGYFYEGPGVPGNMVVAYDGQTWNNLGGGITFDDQGSNLGVVYDILFWNDRLYASGQFYRAGGAPVEHIAQWDGHRWCGSGADFAPDNAVRSMTVWRDTLYVAGGFSNVNGQPASRVAQFMGSAFEEVCSPAVGLAEVERPGALHAVPLGDGRWSVVLHAASTYQVTDMRGAAVLRGRAPGSGATVVDLGGIAPGMYALAVVPVHGPPQVAKLFR